MSTSPSKGEPFAVAQAISNEPILEMKDETTKEGEESVSLKAEYDFNEDRKSKLKMYSDIQNMVANISVDSRIASITGGGKTLKRKQ